MSDNQETKVESTITTTVTETPKASADASVPSVPSAPSNISAKDIKDTQEIVKEVVAEVIKETYDDIFVTEEDTFDVTIEYYKQGKENIVESVDDEFDPKAENIKSFTMRFKYPAQRDQEAIMSTNLMKSPSKMEVTDIIQLELLRINILVRSWSVNRDLSTLPEADPKIIKAICNKIRDEIGMRGIF